MSPGEEIAAGMNDRGSTDLLLLLALAGLTLVPATVLATSLEQLDTVAGRAVLYAGAVGAAWQFWRKLVRPVLAAVEVILGLDHRVGRIEEHLGIAPAPSHPE